MIIQTDDDIFFTGYWLAGVSSSGDFTIVRLREQCVGDRQLGGGGGRRGRTPLVVIGSTWKTQIRHVKHWNLEVDKKNNSMYGAHFTH